MKRILYILLAVILLSTVAVPPAGALVGYEPSITDGKDYKEMVFLSGKPVLYSGEVKATSKLKEDVMQTTLTYKLTSSVSSDTLTRTIKMDSKITKNGSQEVYDTKITNLTETVQAGGNKLKLKKDGYFFSASKVIDHRPVIDFFTENWYFKRIYELGKGKNYISVVTSGTTDGYSSAWGAGTTGTMNTNLESVAGDSTGSAWKGTVQGTMLASTTHDLRYIPSAPQLISYSGGYVEESAGEESLRISYDMPTVGASSSATSTTSTTTTTSTTSATTINDTIRNTGTTTTSVNSPPTQKRLFIREYKDVRGHWAQNSIEAMSGLGVFDNTGNFFGPGLMARREDLARGLSMLCNLVQEGPVKKTALTKKAVPEQPYFVDVQPDDQYYKYVQEIQKRNIVVGITEKTFRPHEPLTRAEAATALITALGLNRLAPTPGFKTSFADDSEIPNWAKDSVYVANELGIIKGDSGFFRPNDTMTRAELAVILDGFRTYLSRDFKKDYADHVYSFK
ncbi:MAG: S-layer homology domain-containing protein [Acidobacteriota bacterium]